MPVQAPPLPSLPFPQIDVPRVERPSRAEFMARVRGARPFIVRGCIDHWPLYRSLSQLATPAAKLQHLSRLLPQRKVRFTHLPPEEKGVFGYNDGVRQSFAFNTQRLRFPEFADACVKTMEDGASGTLYMQNLPLPELHAQLGVLDQPEGFAPIAPPSFWIGTGGQKVALHSDAFRNIITMLAGRKRLTLFAPDELPNLYIAPPDRRVGGSLGSLVKLTEPDFDKFPKFRAALQRSHVAVLEPGEILYLPSLWWHHVESFDLNIGLNCFFREQRIDISSYVPATGLMVSLRHTSLDIRRRLHDGFAALLSGQPNPLSADTPFASDTAGAAAQINAALDTLTPDQAALWRAWVLAFVGWCVFRLEEPFPTLPAGEVDRMLERMSSWQWKLSQTLRRTMFRAYERVGGFTVRQDQSIVPLAGR